MHFESFDEGDDPTDRDGVKLWLDGHVSSRLKDLAHGRKRYAFCDEAQSQVQKLIIGPTVGICDECVAVQRDRRRPPTTFRPMR